MMHTAVADWAGAGITDRMKTFYAAHNEYLELLLTTGAAGLAAWLWFVIAHLRRAAQNWLRPGVAPVTLALVSYLAHAVISIRVSMIFPELCFFSRFCRCSACRRKGIPRQKRPRQSMAKRRSPTSRRITPVWPGNGCRPSLPPL